LDFVPDEPAGFFDRFLDADVYERLEDERLPSARWSASVLPDHFRDTRTRRPGSPRVVRRSAA